MAKTIVDGYIPTVEVSRLPAELEANLDPAVYSEVLRITEKHFWKVLRIIEQHLWLSVGVGFASECS